MRCKINDLAFIRKALRPSNIGLIVQCTQLIGHLKKDDIFMVDGENWQAPDTGDYWQVTSASGSLETLFGKSKKGFIMDSWLTPINPPSMPVDESEKLLKESELLV